MTEQNPCLPSLVHGKNSEVILGEHLPIPVLPDLTGEAEELQALSRAIAYADGFKLFFLCCDHAPSVEQLICRLYELQPHLRMHQVRLHTPVSHLLDALQNETIAHPIDVLIVHGIEFSLPRADIAEHSAFIANLNAARNSFPQFITTPLNLVLPEFALRAVMRGAPDFFSVRSGVYFFQQRNSSDAHIPPVGKSLSKTP